MVNCNKQKVFRKRLVCKIKKEVCDKTNHEIAKAGTRLYSVLNPAHAIAVPIVEVASPIVRKIIC